MAANKLYLGFKTFSILFFAHPVSVASDTGSLEWSPLLGLPLTCPRISEGELCTILALISNQHKIVTTEQ
jgi:hypothetical protein